MQMRDKTFENGRRSAANELIGYLEYAGEDDAARLVEEYMEEYL